MVPADQLLARAREKAEKLAAKAPYYVRMAKRLLHESIEHSLTDHLQLERHGIADSMGTERPEARGDRVLRGRAARVPGRLAQSNRPLGMRNRVKRPGVKGKVASMRRASALAVVAVLAVLGLAACGGGSDNNDTTAAATPPATTPPATTTGGGCGRWRLDGRHLDAVG